MRCVDRQNADRCASNRSSTHEHNTIPREMSRPLVSTRMVQPSLHSGPWVDATEIGAFVMIARVTCQCQIRSDGWSLMLFRDDVVDLKWRRGDLFGETAVFTTAAGTFADQSF